MNRFLKVLSLMLVMFLVSGEKAFSSGAKVVLSFKDNVNITGKSVELGEICNIDCSDLFITKNLKNIVICSTPKPGKERMLSKYEILAALKKAGFPGKRVVFKGPVQKKFNFNSRVLKGEEIIEAAKNYILNEGAYNKNDVIFEISGKPKDLLIPKGNVKFEVMPLSNNNFMGNCFLSVNVVVDGQMIDTIPITIKTRVFDNVLVPKGNLPRYSSFSKDDFEIERREITRIKKRIIKSYSEIENLIPRKNIKKKQILTADMFEEPKLIKRGDIVKILFDNGVLMITAKGIALKDGKKGDVILVRNIDSKKVITAVVSGKRLVKINI